MKLIYVLINLTAYSVCTDQIHEQIGIQYEHSYQYYGFNFKSDENVVVTYVEIIGGTKSP